MKTNVLYRSLQLTGIVLMLLLASVTVQAGPSPQVRSGESWLSFDGVASAGRPELALLGASADAIDLRAGLPGCAVETVEIEGQTYSRLYGAGYGQGVAIGLPDLPVLRQGVEIPFGASVTLQVVEATYRDVPLADLGLAPILPQQPPVPDLAEDQVRPLTIEQAFYERGSLYPGAPVALGEQYIVRGHRVQLVEVWPVAYDPDRGVVRLYSEVRFRLRLVGSDMGRTQALAERYASPAFETRLAQELLNYNQGRPPARFRPADEVGYLVVVADAYYDAIQPLVELRDRRGFAVTVVRTSEIPGGASNTNIKAYIVNAYGTWPIPPSYVLLVGDIDTVPSWAGVTISASTDLYYGCMDPGDDWHPDIGRGRFPVRSVQQTTAMVDKYLAYADLYGDEPWLKRAAFVASCVIPEAEPVNNEMIERYTLPWGYWGTFPNVPQPGGDKLYCASYGATRQDVQDAINEGRWLVTYFGHGGTDGWEYYETPDVQALENHGMYPFVASVACSTGNFDAPEVTFGEAFVLREGAGALAFLGSVDPSDEASNVYLEQGLFERLFAAGEPRPSLADITDHGLVLSEYYRPMSAQFMWENYNILGDPAVKLFLETDLPRFSLGAEPALHDVCDSGAVTSTVTVGSIYGYSGTVELELGALPAGVSASVVPLTGTTPFTAGLVLTVSSNTAPGDYPVVIAGSDHISWTYSATVDLRVRDGPAARPALVAPPDGARDQPFSPTLQWAAVPLASSYHLQVGYGPLFAAPLLDVSAIATTSLTLGSQLEPGRCYWWRVGGDNACGAGEWAAPFHFAVRTDEIKFQDNMEGGAGQWSHQATVGSDSWVITTTESHSPVYAWYVPDDPDITDSRLWNTVPVHLDDGSALTFWHRFRFEFVGNLPGDGGVLEVSTDGGSTWTDLGPDIVANGYNGTLDTRFGNPLGGRQAWTGDQYEWSQVEVDLSTFAGQDVQVRWRLGCDNSLGDVGWNIDDVQIVSTMPPGPPLELADIAPREGTAGEETPVQISGSGFLAEPAVRLGPTWLLSITLVSSTTLEAVVPAGLLPGTYALTLVNGDCQELVLPNAFTVTAGPCVSPTAALQSDSPVEMGWPLHLTATVVTGTAPFTYTWDMGGPGAGIGLDTATPTFTYTAYGSFTVTVVVTNACGSDAVSLPVEILCDSPEAAFASSGPVLLGQPMHLTATVTGTAPFAYTWDMGGPGAGIGLDTATPTFTYTAYGSFTVTVVVTNACGSDAVSVPVEIRCDSPEASFVSSGPVLLGQPLYLTATVTGTGPYTYTWTLGDGIGVLYGANVSYTYTVTGDYTVTLTVAGPCGTDVATAAVTVLPQVEWYSIYLPGVFRGYGP